MQRRIPVAAPQLGPNETRYVNEALAEGALSGNFGRFLSRLEAEFAEYCECEHGVAVSNGTTALHLALAALGIGRDDEVLVATLTNMATCFAIHYQGAKPIPIDVEPDTCNLDPRLLAAQVTPRTRAIMVVHLFGHPVDMDPVLEVAKQHNLYVIEDAAEAHGATYKGRKVGSLGDIACFSFYANKIITTGEGGMVTTKNRQLAERAASLKSLAYGGADNRFMHSAVGFNYRLPNLQAAIGCAQLERIEEIIARKRSIAGYYTERLRGLGGLQLPVEKPYARNVYWMYHIALTGRWADKRQAVMQHLAMQGIETRPGFVPYNMQEIFVRQGLTRVDACPIANSLAARGFYLPTGVTLTDADLDYVCRGLEAALAEVG